MDKIIPIFTFAFGYLLNTFERRREENKTLARYEHSLIVDILEIFDNEEKTSDKMLELHEKQKRDPLYFKIKDYDTIRIAINNGLKNKKVDTSNLKNIKNNLENEFKRRSL